MSKYSLTSEQVKDMLVHVCSAVVNSEELLAQADRDIGDGDHGIGMSLGFSSAKEVLVSRDFDDAYAVFSTMGRTLISVMGGASGIIFGLLFYGGSKGKGPKNELNTDEFYSLFLDSLKEIQLRGKAQVGDKTMIDALEPMVVSIGKSVVEGLSFKELLPKAQQAAMDGMEKSKQYVAKFGKAKALGERAIGYPDAGAVSITVIAKAMNEWAQKNL